MKKLKDICYLLNGYSFKSSNYKNLGYRIIRITNVQKGWIEDKNPVFYEHDIKLNKYELIENDLLISLTGNVGRVGIVTNDILPAYLNQRVGCLRIKNSAVLPEYLYYILNTSKFELDCIRASNGIAQLNLSTEWLKEYEIEVPSIEKQKEIIYKMNLISNNIEIRKKQIKNYNELIKSQFVEMFGDPVLNDFKWKQEYLAKLGTFKNGINFDKTNNGEEISFLGVGNFKNGRILSKKEQLDTILLNDKIKDEYLLKNNDIIFVRSNGSKELVGRTTLIKNIDFDLTYSGFCIRFRNENKNINPIFLIELFNNDRFFRHLKKDNRGANINNINQQMLSKLDIIIPPIELQNKFAKIVEQIDKQKFQFEKSLKKLEELQSSLMQEYFG